MTSKYRKGWRPDAEQVNFFQLLLLLSSCFEWLDCEMFSKGRYNGKFFSVSASPSNPHGFGRLRTLSHSDLVHLPFYISFSMALMQNFNTISLSILAIASQKLISRMLLFIAV